MPPIWGTVPAVTRKGWIAGAAVLAGLTAVVLLDQIAGDAPGVDPAVKTQIDRLAEQHDCVGLQDWFDATTNDAPKQLDYINDKMEDVGCYND